MDVADLGFDRLHDIAGVAAPKHQDEAADHFPLRVQHRGAVTHRVSEPDFRHVPHEDRRAPHFPENDVLDVLKRPDEPDAAHDVLFVVALQDVAAGVRIVLGHRLVHIVKRQVVFAQQTGVHDDLILLDVASQRVHVDDIGQPLEHRTNDPVHERPAFG